MEQNYYKEEKQVKKNKILKITLIILLIVLVSIISFGGIFVENKNSMKNIVPDYKLGRDLTGSRKVKIEVDASTKTINYDANGNIIEDNHTHEEGEEHSDDEIASTKQVPVNKEEDLTVDNYKKSKEILENRLKNIGANDYTIRLNEEDGSIVFELPEDDNTDLIISQLKTQGKFEIVNADTKEVLMTNNDIEKVLAGVGSTSSGYVAYMQIQFNKQGTEKLKDITNTYVKVSDSDGNTVEKKVTLKLDDTDIMSSSFTEEISDGILQLTIGNASRNINSEDIQSNYLSAISDAQVLNSGKTPIVYTTSQNKYVLSDITLSTLNIAIYVGIAIIVVSLLYLMIRYKKLGILSSIAFIGYIALLLLALRYTNVEISVTGVFGIALSIVINYIFNIIILNHLKKEENTKLAFGRAISEVVMLAVPAYIMAIVFTFFNSFGTVMFWGLTIILLYNYIINKVLITENNK